MPYIPANLARAHTQHTAQCDSSGKNPSIYRSVANCFETFKELPIAFLHTHSWLRSGSNIHRSGCRNVRRCQTYSNTVLLNRTNISDLCLSMLRECAIPASDDRQRYAIVLELSKRIALGWRVSSLQNLCAQPLLTTF